MLNPGATHLHSKPCMNAIMPSDIKRQASQLLTSPETVWDIFSFSYSLSCGVEFQQCCKHAPHEPKPGKLPKLVLVCETSAINPELEKILTN